MATAEEYAAQQAAVAERTSATLQSTDGTVMRPTPTQEENDKLALGLMHPDDKVSPQDKASAPAARTTTTTTTASRTTTTTGASGATGA